MKTFKWNWHLLFLILQKFCDLGQTTMICINQSMTWQSEWEKKPFKTSGQCNPSYWFSWGLHHLDILSGHQIKPIMSKLTWIWWYPDLGTSRPIPSFTRCSNFNDIDSSIREWYHCLRFLCFNNLTVAVALLPIKNLGMITGF